MKEKKPPALTLTERKRRDILAACIAEFRAHGFAAARIDRIADRAQVSKRTLYRHFPSKETMFDTIATIVLAPVPAEKRIAFDPGAPLRPQLAQLLHGYVAAISEENHLIMSRIILSEFITDTGRALQMNAREETIAGPLEAFLAEAMAAGAMRKADLTHATIQLSALVKAFFFWPRLLSDAAVPDANSRERIIDDCTEMFVGHYT